MERFKISCEIAGKLLDLQFDIKKIPGEVGPCYMVTIDGLFHGYVKKEKSGLFRQLMNSNFTEADLTRINQQLGNLDNIKKT